MSKKRGTYVYSMFWNCGLIAIGSLIQAIALKSLGIPYNFVPGGLFGVGSLIYYKTGWLDPGLLYLLLNIPMFILGYIFISRRFLGFSALAMGLITLFYQLIDFRIAIGTQLYAALVFGALLGTGAGMVLRSLGSNGGLDVAAVILNQKFNIGVGKVYFVFNLLLFSLSFASLDNDLVIASMIAVFVCSVAVDYVLSLFNQRKMAFIISEKPEEIAGQVMNHLKIGTTMLPAVGAFRREQKTVLMVVINNIQLKRLEEIVFTADNYALFIVGNTFSVLGSTFSRRKIY
ncbi:membrane protein [Desulfuromonas versatilis]|uniref:Membrane protein n=1 Tax=Desulfuromonas versatilis TaxID=2802975 RepID=A0ABN6E489_9BACT|nr:YitT family protein [Desulfuromonas versatilis]BCR07012.1 membrane protein [Desulfuromonas versatilis]